MQWLDAIQSTLLAVDLMGYLKNGPWCGVAALRIVSQHAKYWSEPIRVNIETQLVELATVIGETALDPEVRRALTTSSLDSLVSCAWWHAGRRGPNDRRLPRSWNGWQTLPRQCSKAQDCWCCACAIRFPCERRGTSGVSVTC